MARFMALVSRMLWIKKKLNGAIQLREETVLGEILQSGESVQKLFLQRAPFNNVLKSYQCHYSWHYFQGCWKWKKNWKRSCLRGGIPILCFSSCSLDIRTQESSKYAEKKMIIKWKAYVQEVLSSVLINTIFKNIWRREALLCDQNKRIGFNFSWPENQPRSKILNKKKGVQILWQFWIMAYSGIIYPEQKHLWYLFALCNSDSMLSLASWSVFPPNINQARETPNLCCFNCLTVLDYLRHDQEWSIFRKGI